MLRPPKLSAWVLTLVFIQCLFPSVSQSHEGRPVYIEISEAEQGIYKLQWKIPPVMTSGDEPFISLSGAQCQIISGRRGPSLDGQKTVRCSGPSPQDLRIELQYPNDNPALSSLIQVRRLSGSAFSLFNGPETLLIKLPEQLGAYQVGKQYTQGGLLHILEGYDHLLFVLCLMHIAGRLRRVLITITGFTVAHSITLALASLKVITLRAELVEVLIALSLVMLTVEIAKAAVNGIKTGLIWRHPATVASLLGLLHGLGFAGALSELGLPHAMKLSALAFFNLGVELGQLLFIAGVVALLHLHRRISLLVYSRVRPSKPQDMGVLVLPTSLIYLLGGLSCYWLIQRSFSLIV